MEIMQNLFKEHKILTPEGRNEFTETFLDEYLNPKERANGRGYKYDYNTRVISDEQRQKTLDYFRSNPDAIFSIWNAIADAKKTYDNFEELYKVGDFDNLIQYAVEGQDLQQLDFAQLLDEARVAAQRRAQLENEQALREIEEGRRLRASSRFLDF